MRVDNVTIDEATEIIDRFVRGGGAHQVATVNPEFVMAAQENAEFKAVLDGADLCVPDGIGLIWGSRILGQPLRERVPGVDLVRELGKLGANRGYRLF
ncbi:MAG: WecB/TagA/CpsF family glycosyltransferase, partial [Chloroflexota bacterium]|nr:WecB/TagA/CpsF family glycosyltransferase [Chloroflexota bacterium]